MICSVFDILNDVGINIVASVICTAIGFLANILLTKIKDARYSDKISRALLIKGDRGCPIEFDCYYANSGEYDSGESLYLGYPLEYMGTASFRAYLQDINKNTVFYSTACPATVDEVLKINKNKNIMLIGGPFHNIFTGLLFGLSSKYSNVPFYFDTFEGEDATLFYNNGNEIKRFKPVYDKLKKCYVEDYGIIFNIKSPFAKDKRIIAVIGCRSLGTYAAAIYFDINGDKISKIAPYDEYAIVIKCEGDNDNLNSNPEFVFACGIDSIKLEQIKRETIKDIEIKVK